MLLKLIHVKKEVENPDQVLTNLQEEQVLGYKDNNEPSEDTYSFNLNDKRIWPFLISGKMTKNTLQLTGGMTAISILIVIMLAVFYGVFLVFNKKIETLDKIIIAAFVLFLINNYIKMKGMMENGLNKYMKE